MSRGINTEFRDLWAIQRMDMVSKDCNIPFSKRFKNDLMAATEYERGYLAQCIRTMDEGDCEIGTLKVAGIELVVAFRPSILNKERLQEVLTQLWNGGWCTHDHVGFDQRSYDEYLQFLNKTKGNPIRWDDYRTRDYHVTTNAWFDIENGFFWTWEKCNPKDLIKNFRQSVQYFNKVREAKENKPPIREKPAMTVEAALAIIEPREESKRQQRRVLR